MQEPAGEKVVSHLGSENHIRDRLFLERVFLWCEPDEEPAVGCSDSLRARSCRLSASEAVARLRAEKGRALREPAGPNVVSQSGSHHHFKNWERDA